MDMVINQYDVFLINLDPTIGHEIKKTRPCLIISPDEINESIRTIIIAPLTTKSHPYPTRIPVTVGGKDGWIVLDQVRTVDKARCIKKLDEIDEQTIKQVKDILFEMLVL